MSRRRSNGEGTICRRRDGLYMAQLTVGRKPDGKLDRRTIYARTAAEVKKKLLELQIDLLNGRVTSPTNETLGEYLDRWFRDHKDLGGRDGKGLRPNTIDNYERLIRLHIGPCIGSVPIRELTPAYLKGLYRDMRAKGLSIRMAEMAHQLLHVALKTAKEEERLITDNPCDLLKDRPKAKYDPNSREVLGSETAITILRELRKSPYYLALALAMTTGMRRAEISGLIWSDINLELGLIHVTMQLQKDRAGALSRQPVKTPSSDRIIPLPTDILELLRTEKARRKPGEGEFVCLNAKGHWIRPDSLSYKWKVLRNQFGLPSTLVFHDIRHSFTNWHAELGTDIKTVSHILGHSSEATTLAIYRKVTEKTQSQAMKAMEGFIQGATSLNGQPP